MDLSQQIPQQDGHSSTIKQKIQETKSFASTGIWTHHLLTLAFLPGICISLIDHFALISS